MYLIRINIVIFVILIFCILFYNLTELLGEDGLVEYLSVFYWAVGLFFSGLILLKQTKKRINKLLVLILLFVCFISLGEEISWGQRIFNIQTPESISKANSQGEINFHNLYALSGGSTWREFFKTGKLNYHLLLDAQNIFRIGYAILFFLFPFMITINFKSNILRKVGYVKPSKCFTLFILLFLTFSYLITIGKPISYNHGIQEIREMFYAFTIAMYLYFLYKRTNLTSSNRNN